MKQAIPRNRNQPLEVGDQVQIIPEWQNPGDNQFERFVIEVPEDSTRVFIQTIIPSLVHHPTEWIEADKLVCV